MEITLNVNVNAPELATAITTLAAAFGSNTSVSLSEVGKVPQSEKSRTSKGDKKATASEDKPQDKKAVETPDKETPDPEEKVITLEEVRAKLAELTRAGKPVKELITKFGASKLSEIPPEKFAEVLKEAEGL